jgi:peptidoglycan/LPS O-acetylase OafA/YrhL
MRLGSIALAREQASNVSSDESLPGMRACQPRGQATRGTLQSASVFYDTRMSASDWPSHPTLTSSPYRPDIDCLRAIAVLAVMFSHWKSRHVAGGYVGVDVFFVISGYLITRMVYTESLAGTFSFITFYERRIRRIIPALYAMVAVVAILSLFYMLPADEKSFSRSVLAVVAFVSNILFWREAGYFDQPSLDKPLLHTWSLSVEEQFYLVFPLFIVLLVTWTRGRERIVLTGALLASFGLNVWAVRTHPHAAFYLAPGRAWEFLLGSILAVGGLAGPRTSRVRIGAITAGVTLILLAVLAFNERTPFPGERALIPCAGAALCIWGYTGAAPHLSLLVFRVPVFLGKISYSLYLWHWPVLIFYRKVNGVSADVTRLGTLELAAMFAVTTTIAYGSYRYIERPIRSRAVAADRRFLFAATACASVLLIAFGAAGTLNGGFPQRLDPTIAAMAGHSDYPIDDIYERRICFLDPEQTFSDLRLGECVKSALGAKSFLVWGDSVAAHSVHGLRQAAAGSGIAVSNATASACPPVFDLDQPDRQHCRGFNDRMRTLIQSRPLDAVVIAAAWPAYTDGLGYEAFVTGLRKTVIEISDTGVDVILIGPPIRYRDPLPQILSRFALSGLEHFHSSQFVVGRGFEIDARMSDDFSNMPRVHYLSVLRSLCRDRSCPALIDGVPMQWDRQHLTAPGSELVARKLFPAIAAVVHRKPQD